MARTMARLTVAWQLQWERSASSGGYGWVALHFCVASRPSPELTTFVTVFCCRLSIVNFMMPREIRTLFVSSLLCSVVAFERAQFVPRGIPEEATYEGGWARGIAGATCPSDASVTCSATSLTNKSCCPAGQFCFGVSSYYCCPTSKCLLLLSPPMRR